MEATRTHQATARAPRLGDRVRQLRVAAGMTQTDLAADRFSKEYISQIERGKTRPTSETVEWLAARLGVDATFLASGVSTDDRARAEAVLARAEALVEKLEFGEARRRVRPRALAGRLERIGRAPGPAPVRRGVGPDAQRRRSRRHRAARPRPRPRRGPRVLRHGPRRGRLPPRRRPLPDLEHRHRRRAFRRGARADRSLPAPFRPPAREHPHVARALLPPPARLRGSAGGHRGRPRAGRRRSRIRTPSARRISRPRSSPSATATGFSRAPTRSAPRRSTRRRPKPPTSGGCSTTSEASSSCSAGRRRRSRA